MVTRITNNLLGPFTLVRYLVTRLHVTDCDDIFSYNLTCWSRYLVHEFAKAFVQYVHIACNSDGIIYFGCRSRALKGENYRLSTPPDGRK